jgi:hypothetical protein
MHVSAIRRAVLVNRNKKEVSRWYRDAAERSSLTADVRAVLELMFDRQVCHG